MRKSIQCWQCGTRMTLDALASNDGDCPECEVEIHLGEYLSEALDTNQRLEAELAATVKDSLTVGKAQMARDSAELRRLCAERDKLKAKAAVPGWMTTPEAFAERAYHAGWRDIADAQHEGIAVMYDELFASAQAQPQSYGVIVPRAIAERMAIDAAQYEHEHAVVNDNVQLWQQPRARLTLTVGDLRTVRALLGGDQPDQPGSAKGGEE